MADKADQPGKDQEKPGFLKRLWLKLDIQPVFILIAMKGALPATIALAAYEAKVWADTYSTLGYLVAIMAHLGMAIQPRAKFIQSIFISVLFICVGSAMALLQIKCVVAARRTPAINHKTGSSGSQETVQYDAAACTVSAVFLFVWVFLANFVKSARPQMMLPMIQFSIFTIVASVYAPSFPNMAAGESFVEQLLISFLTGFAIATGVSLFVIPITSRASVTKQMAGVTKLFKACIYSHSAYMDSVSSARSDGDGPSEEENQNAEKLKQLLIKANDLLGKVKLEVGFARKEIAYGKLCAENFTKIYNMLREINQPILGMSTFLGIVRSLRERKESFAGIPDARQAMDAIRKLAAEEWDEVVQISNDARTEYQKALCMGLDHIVYQLELEERPKKKAQADVEGEAGVTPQPGDANFATYLEVELKKYQAQRNSVIQDWAQHRNINLPQRFWENQTEKPSLARQETAFAKQKLNQHQLYLILYMNFLGRSLGQAILKLARYADSLVEDGTMKKKRFINPGWRRLRKLIEDAFRSSNTDETLTADVNGGSNIYLGDALNKRKDPEHLPPVSFYERFTDYLRKIPALLASEHASFAFRAAVAAMSIAILGYLHQTRNFFLAQRGMWAMIMTAISMDPHAGQGLFGFAARIAGTAFAMVASIAIWYMCDHNHAAILVVFWLYMSCWILFLVKMPQYAVVSMISSITVILIAGYELQVDVIGRALSTSNGQQWYPVYLLGPYRLATVCIGLGVAFFWTYFPYPYTTHGALRQDIGSTLYILANYYSCVHTTLDVRVHLGPAINDLPANSPVKKLDSAREKAFSKVILMMLRLQDHHRFTKFEPPFGGRFPRETYKELINSIRNVFSYLALITYSSNAYITEPEGQTPEEAAEEAQWLRDFREFSASTKVTSHEITTNLCLLSAAIRNSQPLPPYLQAPRPFAVGDKMEEIDPALLGVQHFAHPCYAAFAVGEVASAFLTAEIAKITRLVKELVGEVDFSFHIVSTADDGSSTNSTLWEKESLSKGVNGGNDKRKGD